jgi:hypothetical protein
VKISSSEFSQGRNAASAQTEIAAHISDRKEILRHHSAGVNVHSTEFLCSRALCDERRAAESGKPRRAIVRPDKKSVCRDWQICRYQSTESPRGSRLGLSNQTMRDFMKMGPLSPSVKPVRFAVLEGRDI